MSLFRTAPVTAECLILCTALYVICQFQALETSRFRDAQRQWGAALTLQMVPLREGAPDTIHRQLYGPFDVWDGQWWRIPLNALHHAGPIHLILNVISGWLLGKRLEARWGSARFAVFLIPAMLLPLLLEFLVGNSAVGFSGAICAMLGALIVLGHLDRSTEPDPTLQFGLGIILLGIPASALDVVEVANLAHVSGVLYGAAAAWCSCRRTSSVTWISFVAAHLAVIPGVWLAVHPPFNGRYLWYVADQMESPDRREALLKRAVSADPALTGVWLRLASHRMIEGDPRAAWRILLAGLNQNPVDADLFAAVRSLWRRIPHGPERDLAEAELRRTFGEQAEAWSRQIRTGGALVQAEVRPKAAPAELDPAQFPLDQPIDLQWEPPVALPRPIRTPDPTDPDSAREGQLL